uniref:GTP-binding protein Rhes n=1 Tax=Steinernema glaseri TaxID=37863 RepID=A0A1I7Z9Q6_9BILA
MMPARSLFDRRRSLGTVLQIPEGIGNRRSRDVSSERDDESSTYTKARSPGGPLLAMRRGSFAQLFSSAGFLANPQGGSNPLLAAPSTSQTSLYSSGSGSYRSPVPTTEKELTRVLFRADSENDENNEQSSSDASSTAEVTESLYPAAVKELEQLGLHRAGGPGTSSGIFNVLTNNASSSGVMRRVMRVIVAGSKRVGKTACLQQLARFSDITRQPYGPTIDDTYQVQFDYPDRAKEVVVFHDTAGISDYGPVELRRPYIQVADAFILVYAVNDHESFNRMDMLKKFIEKQFGKDKKEVPIVVLGNKTDQPGRKVDFDFATSWAAKERVKLFEVTATDRNSLLDAVNYLSSRYFHPPKESKFSLSKKLKPEKSNTAIVMDF